METNMISNSSATLDGPTANALIGRVFSHAPVETASQKRVMHITWSLVAGGAEIYAYTIASGLDKKKFHAEQCGIDQGGALEEEIKKSGIPYQIMHRKQGIDFRLFWKMHKLFRRHQIDVIHTHHFNQLFYSLPAALLQGIRIIHTEHSIEAYKQPKYRKALKFMSRFCHRITVIGDDGLKTLRDKVGIRREKLQVIRAGVNLDKFKEHRYASRRELGLEATDRVAVIIARLYPEKNHQLLLEAFSNDAVQRIPGAKLLIVGDGIEREAIAQTIQQRNLGHCVHMLGVRRDIPRILAASDCYILCSDREGLPIAVLEAMAASRPVIATTVGDLPLIISDNETGRLVAPKNPAALAQAIAQVLEQPEKAKEMGARARQFVEQNFSLQNMISEHEKLYT